MPRVGGFAAASGLLAAVSLVFFWQQNFGGQIGGAMSLPKLLWLDYALISWFILPAFLCRCERLDRRFRRLFAIHLVNFCARGAIELYLLYVTVSWSPIYGIGHDVFSILLITFLSPVAGDDPLSRAARHFTWTLRLALTAEIVFAAMFHSLTAGESAIYFASTAPRFGMINAITTVVVVVAYADLLYVIGRLRSPSDSALPEVAAHA